MNGAKQKEMFEGGGGQKTEYFLGYQDFVDIFCGSAQNWNIY